MNLLKDYFNGKDSRLCLVCSRLKILSSYQDFLLRMVLEDMGKFRLKGVRLIAVRKFLESNNRSLDIDSKINIPGIILIEGNIDDTVSLLPYVGKNQLKPLYLIGNDNIVRLYPPYSTGTEPSNRVLMILSITSKYHFIYLLNIFNAIRSKI